VSRDELERHKEKVEAWYREKRMQKQIEALTSSCSQKANLSSSLVHISNIYKGVETPMHKKIEDQTNLRIKLINKKKQYSKFVNEVVLDSIRQRRLRSEERTRHNMLDEAVPVYDNNDSLNFS
jgi:hypothetical protein